MRFTVDSQKLYEGFQYVGSIITSMIPRPLYQNVKIAATTDSVLLSATDLEIGLRIEITNVETDQAGSVLLPEAKVSQILGTAPGENITFEGDKTAVTIKTEDSEFRIYAESAEEFLDVPSVNGEGICIDPDVLRYMVRRTVFATAEERGRYALNGVLISVAKDGSIEMAAADGARMALVRKKVSNPEAAEVFVIVPKKGVEQLACLAGLCSDPVRFRVTENQLIAENTVGGLCAQLVEGQFPDYQQIIPGQQEIKVELPTKPFLNAISRAALVATERTNVVDLSFSDAGLLIHAESAEFGSSEVRLRVTYEASPKEISFNPVFLEDALKVLERDSVRLEFSDRASPATLRAGVDFTYVISPVVREEAEA